jgi:ADP-ribosylglycohydrolase
MRSDVPPAVADRYAIHTNLEPVSAFIDEVDGMPIDDDIDYIAVGLGVLQQHGLGFDSIDVGNLWLEELPMFNTYTAERVAYRNLANLVMPPESATHRNPYRESVGALIRADPWGFAAVGDPTRAAELAFRDARVSHVKNGIYGEMWAAAMIAAAPVAQTLEAVLDAGLAVVPETSRLAEEIETVRAWHREGLGVEEATHRIHDRWDETEIYRWVHTLSNAQVVAMGLLWSDGDFGEAVCRAVEAGFDTDSHAATIGSVLGAYHGADALPASWIEPLDGRVSVSLPSFGTESIEALAKASMAVWERS